MRLRTIGLISIIVLGLLVGPLPTEAQQAEKVPRIGIVISGSVGKSGRLRRPYRKFVQRLGDLGYIEGKNLLIEYRFTGKGRRDRKGSPPLVNELVQQKVDVLVVGTLTAIRAAKKATKTIPVVMVLNYDPVPLGLVDNLARPGGNITGISHFDQQLSAKRVELLMEVIPRMSRLAFLWNPTSPGSTIAFKETKAVAQKLKLDLQSLEIRNPNPDLEGAFQAAKKERREALIIVQNPTTNRYRKRIMELVTRNRLPSMTGGGRWVRRFGALMSYSSNHTDSYRRAATYVDKILRGAKPEDLPIERPTKFELIINLKTAKQLGLTIPPEILIRADRVIK